MSDEFGLLEISSAIDRYTKTQQLIYIHQQQLAISNSTFTTADRKLLRELKEDFITINNQP